jgi:hypothetical protein
LPDCASLIQATRGYLSLASVPEHFFGGNDRFLDIGIAVRGRHEA